MADLTPQQAARRLTEQLPLYPRQQALPAELKALHQAILHSFIRQGRPLAQDQAGAILHEFSWQAALQRLAQDDLIVADAERQQVLGAYPMTMQATPHRIRTAGWRFHAMCALDALSIAPMFDLAVRIDSHCHVTDRYVGIDMQGRDILRSEPARGLQVGIHWQAPCGSAAHSMCLQMVFLYDSVTARHWQQVDSASRSLFNLADTVTFGAEFFCSLL